jgi:hypothetical protein
LTITSCSPGKPEKQEETSPLIVKGALSFNNEDLDTLTGIYIGDFGGDDIRIALTHIGKSHVVGYNIFKGLRRNISGKYSVKGDTLIMDLSEPGDNEYDGVFNLEIYRSNFKGKGKWTSNSGKISSKHFNLEKLPPFEYINDVSKLNNSNFTSTFSWVEDSLGSIYFDDDGSCKYTYYPNEDEENRVEQLEEINGSWSLKGNKLTINWQPNVIFPKRRSSLEILVEEEYSFSLIGEGRKFYANNF